MEIERITVRAGGIEQSVLVGGPPDGTPVLFVHGNCSSAQFWIPLLRRLPGTLRVAAPDLRGYGRTETAPVDATRGLADLAADVAALLDEPAVFGPTAPAAARPVVVGHSLGGGVAMRLLLAHPDRVAALLLAAPVSPYGYGGTRDLAGTPTAADFAGTGGGTASADFVARLATGDRGDDPTSPRGVLRATYVADPASLVPDEELLLDSVLSTAVGDDNYPGTSVPSPNWPGMAPGDRGVLNALSPAYFRIADDLVAVAGAAGRGAAAGGDGRGAAPGTTGRGAPPIVWVRGDADVIVSDTALMDLAHLGSLGVVPGWPGAATHPAQPMVGQTRAVLERYAAAGGSYREVVYAGCGHSPNIERPADLAAELLDLLTAVTQPG
ncbi:alpha/beta fold hydrolase [Plantactinospora siamensis]|uniref:Alpha/beta fold hydrolase n=1 Tax=Plantactinospora siamensis TaxID=555372 RepID=A0ABV6NXN3_9ACTN